MTLPKKTFARQIIAMQGYSEEQQIGEVAHIDQVSFEEAKRRVLEAKEQNRNRSVAQYVRHSRAKDRVEEARRRVLSIAQHQGKFLCAKSLEEVAQLANWKTPADSPSLNYWDTGRVFREICLPYEKAGLLQALRNEDDRFIGYTITDAGRRELLGETQSAPSSESGQPGQPRSRPRC